MSKAGWASLPFKEMERKGGTGQCAGDVIDLSFLEGKRIIRTGYLDQSQLEFELQSAGGFAIDYLCGGSVRRVVLGFSDLGFWIEWKGEVGKASQEDRLRGKAISAWSALTSQKVTIEDRPLQRGYSFIGEDGKSVFFLRCSDLKLMGPEVSRFFSSPGVRDVDGVLEAVGLWAYSP